MPSQYNGNVGNVQFPTAKTIIGATNATPIVIQTSAPHQLTTGDFVDVSAVQGNTAANGTWLVQVVDATHVILVGSVGNGAYTAAGTLQSLADGPTYEIPSDGDAPGAASVNVAFEALGDRTATNRASIGANKLLRFWQTQTDDNATENTFWTSLLTLSLQNTWQGLGGLASPPAGILQAGDIIEASLDATWVWADSGNSGTGMLLALGISYSVAGVAPGAVVNKMLGAGVVLGRPASNGERVAAHLRGRATVPSNVQTAGLYIMGYTRGATPANFNVQGVGDFQMLGSIWRPTGMPQ